MVILGGLLGVLVAGLLVDSVGMTPGLGAGDGDDDSVLPEFDEDPLPPIMPGSEDPESPDLTDDEVIDAIIDGSEDLDILMGSTGHDLIRGWGNGDDLRGGLGNDTIHAGAGNDWVQGDADYGLGGNDVIKGGAGDDLLAGQGGDDLLFGDMGDDTLMGGEGHDSLFGGAGDDMLAGHDGDDLLVSTEGSDDLDGGRGHDVLIGHDGAETVWMNGGEGDDTLMPGAGDFVSGNEGADCFALRQSDEGFPTIADFDGGRDQIVLHLDADLVADAQLSLREDSDGTFLLELNGDAVGRLLEHGGLRLEDVRIVAVNG